MINIGDSPSAGAGALPPLGRILSMVLVAVISLGGGIVLGQTVTPPIIRQIAVRSTSGWQPTGVSLLAGDRVRVAHTGGTWTEQNGGVPAHDAASLERGYICAQAMPVEQCVEPIPNAPQGALIARVGKQLLAIGNEQEFTANQAGSLSLRMNDTDTGLGDNAGVITVTVTLLGK